MNMMQKLSDCGINPFAITLFWESWARHEVSPRRPISFPFRDSVISIQPIEVYEKEHPQDGGEFPDSDWLHENGFVFGSVSNDQPSWYSYLYRKFGEEFEIMLSGDLYHGDHEFSLALKIKSAGFGLPIYEIEPVWKENPTKDDVRKMIQACEILSKIGAAEEVKS